MATEMTEPSKSSTDAQPGGPPARRTDSSDPVVDRAVPALADEYIAWLITGLAVRLSRGASSYYTRHWGIGSTEYRLMMALGREGPCTAVRAAAAADVDKAAASRSLQVLLATGLVDLLRSGRQMETRLTAEGRALHDRLRAASDERDRRLTTGLSDAEVARLCTDLRRLIDNLPYMNKD